MTIDTPAGLLGGIRVLELATFITGPQAGSMLAQLGADVVKVEAPGGDPFRGPTGYNPAFCAVNFNKRSVTLDLRTPAGQERLAALAADADVLIENFRPGVVERLGITYEALSARNPGLVYCSIGGLDGSPEVVALPAYDSVAQAVTGLLLSLVPAEDPVPVGPPLSDMVTGMYATSAILAALNARHADGAGRRIELSMLSSSLALMAPLFTAYQRTGEVPDSRARTRRSLAFGLLSADERPFVVHVSTAEKFWRALCTAFDRPQWREDPRFSTYAARVAHYDELSALLRARAGGRSRDDWIERLRACDVPCAPAYGLDEVLADESLAVRRWLGSATSPETGEIVGARFPAAFDGVDPPALTTPPPLAPEGDDDISWAPRPGDQD